MSPASTPPNPPPSDDWTPEQLAAFQAWTRGYGEQDENGIDLSLIRENLKLTPLERVRRGDVARRRALEMQEYGRRYQEQLAAGRMPPAAS